MTSTGGATVFAQTALLAPLRALLSALAFGPLADQLRPGADPAQPRSMAKARSIGASPSRLRDRGVTRSLSGRCCEVSTCSPRQRRRPSPKLLCSNTP
jgi:hypothetical protein